MRVRRRVGVIERAQAGDREALAELWRRHQPDVLRYLRTRRATSPDDVASQVWIDVAESIHRFHGDDTAFRAWLFTIVHHRAVDSIRRSIRDDRLAVRSTDAVGTAAPADDELDQMESLDRAVALIASLPDQMGAAVMLRVVNEMPVADVAEVLRTTEGNVRVLVHRGMHRLRRKLDVTERTASTMKGLT